MDIGGVATGITTGWLFVVALGSGFRTGDGGG